MNKGLVAMLAAYLGFASPLGAQPVYVIDQLFVGVHEQKSRESSILELLPSGTKLEVVKRDGKLVQVRTPGGTVGWVDNDYLVSEKPNQTMLADLETRYEQSQQELEAARNKVKELEKQTPACSDEGRAEELVRLRSENTGLKETIASAEAQLSELAQANVQMQAPTVVQPAAPSVLGIPVALWKPPWLWWALGALGVFLVLGFGLGIYLMDYFQRRRHGGFRL